MHTTNRRQSVPPANCPRTQLPPHKLQRPWRNQRRHCPRRKRWLHSTPRLPSTALSTASTRVLTAGSSLAQAPAMLSTLGRCSARKALRAGQPMPRQRFEHGGAEQYSCRPGAIRVWHRRVDAPRSRIHNDGYSRGICGAQAYQMCELRVGLGLGRQIWEAGASEMLRGRVATDKHGCAN